MFFAGFEWFWEVLEGFRRVWEGLGWVGRGGGELLSLLFIVFHCFLTFSTDSEVAI